MNDETIAKKINSAMFPGIQGGPLMHVIAAKAVAFHEALQPEFKIYQQQVAKNAIVLADTLTERGLRIVSGPHRIPCDAGRSAPEEHDRQGCREAPGRLPT